jgi:hypothetical protein
VSVFNRRNAAVGYLVLKVAKRKLSRRRKRSGAKIALFVSLGILSVGILAGLAFVLLRRQQGESEGNEEYAFGQGAESEVVGEYVTTTPEPIPAT